MARSGNMTTKGGGGGGGGGGRGKKGAGAGEGGAGSIAKKKKGGASKINKTSTTSAITKGKGGDTPRRGRSSAGAGAGAGGAKRGKTADDVVEDIKNMTKKAGVQLPKDAKKAKKEVKDAAEKHSYAKQATLQELKETHKVAKIPTAKGDPYAGRAGPPEEEKKKPFTRRKTQSGKPSEMQNVTNEANRKMADSFYELATYVRNGDSVQKGIAYFKAAKAIRTAPKPIKSKADVPAVGKGMVGNVEEYIKTGHVKLLDEYRSGERGQ